MRNQFSFSSFSPLLSDVMLNKNGPSKGLIIIFDQQHMGMRHLMRPTVDGLRAYFRFLQEALPIKLERMFIMNAVSYFDMVLSVIKPFMKSEILNKVSSICKFSSFHFTIYSPFFYSYR